ncbi:MAG: deoxyhypusine synthase [Candidatus Aenigmarchaeota archaeon]|nr:deoxyhypusine synthase [Candidatus Aenigmarchaeota archaeon]NIP40823.1 deoxyhypusine synthase [Candidatus Aenigmarchaeota archaeon]NIQ17937.1 deoxyhypusine synthase [Candidatus Aenigmarchaeota archaeon]NIS73526.1 deoxyhypusine synthase [Candidatus Aenigmarchaeota archaeon]
MEKIKDFNIRKGMRTEEIVGQMGSAGFQAERLARGVEIIREMRKEKAVVFLTFTANMVASGLRSLFARMCEKRMVDVIITTGGGIEHDFIRSFKPYLLGDFSLDDRVLRKKGMNRIGNIIVPNDRYVLLERKMQKLFKRIHRERKVTSPSELAREMGKLTKDRGSFLYWAERNRIPVFSPGITDSAIGLQTYFFKQDHPDFGIDVTGDMKDLANIVLNAGKTGGIILGGGISKHHAIGANIVREGMDYAVYVTTSQPWDGSLSGARTNEAVSWGKINKRANHITIDGDATIVFPLLISEFL